MQKDEINTFMGRLKRLSGDSPNSTVDRAALARLRRGITHPDDDYRILETIGPRLPQEVLHRNNEKEIKAYILLACLYALNPNNGGNSLGTAASRLRSSMKEAGKKSLDLQFSAVIDSNREDLPVHLRHFIHRMSGAAEPISIDYHRLLRDLIEIYSEGVSGERDRAVRKKWSFHYWGARMSDPLLIESESLVASESE